MSDTDRRVVITGIGLVTPIGTGKDAFWAAATDGRSGVGRPTLAENPDLPVQVVGEVKDFAAEQWMPRKLVVRTDRNTHFAFAACTEALADAGIDPELEDKTRIGIVLSADYGGLGYVLDNLVRLHQRGPSFVSAYMAIAWLPSAPVGQLSILYGTTGYSKTVVNDASGGTCAIGAAYRAIRRGDSDVVIAGGFEIPLVEGALASLSTWELICRDSDDPAKAFRPFNREREGVVMAEGGGLVILEELERAQARGATPYAEVAGFAQTTDAVSLRHFAEDGAQYARAMRLALEVGGLGPDDVDYVNADGHGTPLGDRAEAQALRTLLGDRVSAVPVSAPKSMTGNALAGAGPIDTAFALLAMRHGSIAPTINLEEQDPECDLRLVANRSEEATIDVALVASRGAAGANAALVLKRVG
jgi:3-oxoacyl-[acyl-carrier-protein] synthase II